MNLSFNTDFSSNTPSDKDILAVFSEKSEKPLDIQQGMTIKEISEIVSEKILAIIKEQFQATEKEFQTK